MWHMKTVVIPAVVVGAGLGTVTKGMVESIRERATMTDIQKISACWDLRESSESCLVYEQND